MTLSTWCAFLCTVLLITTIAVPRDTLALSPPPQPVNHSRVDILAAWLLAKGCPNYAVWFVNAADVNSIDYKILAVIWFKESTCGKHELSGNGFGFEPSGSLKVFTSDQQAIYYISEQLSQAHPYAGRSTEGKVYSYNSVDEPHYYQSFLSLFNSIK